MNNQPRAKSDVSTTSWHVRLADGSELHGSDVGSFAEIKYRRDIVDLWVITRAGERHALQHEGIKPKGFDFYVHVAVALTGNGKQEKHWKLVTLYPDHTLIRHVSADGSSRTERK
ncbi:MAG: hypothetical protein AB1423_14440 [Pseudomonadota bacterium]